MILGLNPASCRKLHVTMDSDIRSFGCYSLRLQPAPNLIYPGPHYMLTCDNTNRGNVKITRVNQSLQYSDDQMHVYDKSSIYLALDCEYLLPVFHVADHEKHIYNLSQTRCR